MRRNPGSDGNRGDIMGFNGSPRPFSGSPQESSFASSTSPYPPFSQRDTTFSPFSSSPLSSAGPATTPISKQLAYSNAVPMTPSTPTFPPVAPPVYSYAQLAPSMVAAASAEASKGNGSLLADPPLFGQPLRPQSAPGAGGRGGGAAAAGTQKQHRYPDTTSSCEGSSHGKHSHSHGHSHSHRPSQNNDSPLAAHPPGHAHGEHSHSMSHSCSEHGHHHGHDDHHHDPHDDPHHDPHHDHHTHRHDDHPPPHHHDDPPHSHHGPHPHSHDDHQPHRHDADHPHPHPHRHDSHHTHRHDDHPHPHPHPHPHHQEPLRRGGGDGGTALLHLLEGPGGGLEKQSRRISFSNSPDLPTNSVGPGDSVRSRMNSMGSVSLEDLGWDGGRHKRQRGLLARVAITVLNFVRYKANRSARRLALLIALNVAYSSVEFGIGLITGRVELVSDAFHLSFGCGVLLVSLWAMMWSRRKPDSKFTYGYERLEVLAAFTNSLFLLFLSFSLSVEALHAFIEDEAEHRHYLVASATVNLMVNLLGVLFFRNHARMRMLYSRAQDINQHSIFLHVLADSIRSAGIILAHWLLVLGVPAAETLCLGLVAVVVLLLTWPLFRASGAVLLQMTPAGIPQSAMGKALHEVLLCEGVKEIVEPRFWAMVPGSYVGTLTLRVAQNADQHRILQHVHHVFGELGIWDLTVQIDIGG